MVAGKNYAGASWRQETRPLSTGGRRLPAFRDLGLAPNDSVVASVTIAGPEPNGEGCVVHPQRLSITTNKAVPYTII